MNKKQYEENPSAYWEVPEHIGVPLDTNRLQTREESPLWVSHVLPEILNGNNWRYLCVDLGCGTGRYINLAAEYFTNVIGVDFSGSSIGIAKKTMEENHVDNVRFIHTSLEDMKGIEDRSVDFAYSCAVFMHIPNAVKEKAVQELSRILRHDGVAVLLEIFLANNTAFDCPALDEKDWIAMLTNAGLKAEVSNADPFTKYIVRK